MTKEKSNAPERIIKFNERTKELTVTTKSNSMRLSDGNESEDYGHNVNVATFKEAGIKNLVKELNKQKNTYQNQHKQIDQQLNEISEVEVDTAFMKKLLAAKDMDKKQQLLDTKLNAEQMIKDLNDQLREIKNPVGNHIKW